MELKERLTQYGLLMRINRPIGTLLLLWPTLWALWIAGDGEPNPLVALVFVAGVFLMRSAGCVINDFADRKIDGHIERTKQRPLAQGLIRAKEALGLFAVLSVIAFALVLTMNMFTILLSFGALALAAIYPFMKRYTHLPQVVLGAAFGWAIPMAFAAQTESVPLIAWFLYAITLLWTVAYDTMYAMVDRKDDLKIGVKSTAILFGQNDKLIIGLLQMAVIAGFIIIGTALSRGAFYFIGVAVAAGLVVYQLYLIRDRQESACFKAFLNNNWLGAAIFLGLALDYSVN